MKYYVVRFNDIVVFGQFGVFTTLDKAKEAIEKDVKEFYEELTYNDEDGCIEVLDPYEELVAVIDEVELNKTYPF